MAIFNSMLSAGLVPDLTSENVKYGVSFSIYGGTFLPPPPFMQTSGLNLYVDEQSVDLPYRAEPTVEPVPGTPVMDTTIIVRSK